ncbi:MAG: bifunctional DNA-formamidopyrimidine glycosylase/DNA-(apurinic or apyrimidinic site) lyase [Chloroflexi bacterium]|nr:bifunctional DNA-formamidopyrimidine glycosylase/DNA-(apurinic or apyrimidinic site) lyase [Chloroflexota bacterium]
MPELPEVETFVRQLRPACLGQRITNVTLRWPGHIATSNPRQFRQRIRGQKISALDRRGKYLVFSLTKDFLLIHLKMSGDLQVVAQGKPGKHDHTIFHFANKTELRFNDTRKFGRVYLVADPEDVTGDLGPEPLARSFTAGKLGSLLAARRRPLKPLLLDQTVIAGVGNIYADESLHRARLHPQRRSDSLSPAETRALWRSLRRTLNLAIRHNGSSIDWMYRGGEHQNHLRVYGRTGAPCLTCSTPIRHIVLGGRSTHFCPDCQRL